MTTMPSSQGPSTPPDRQSTQLATEAIPDTQYTVDDARSEVDSAAEDDASVPPLSQLSTQITTASRTPAPMNPPRPPPPTMPKKKKPRWTQGQIALLLELYGEARLAGELENGKAQTLKVVHTKIASRLHEEWPSVDFNHIKVKRKLEYLMRLWKAFLAIDGFSGTSHELDMGIVLTNSNLWKYFIEKHDEPARVLKRHGLQHRELYERAFSGSEEVGLTAVEATDRDGLDALHAVELSSENESEEEEEEELATQESGRDASVMSVPPSSQARSLGSARKRRLESSQSSTNSPVTPSAKRPHRAVEMSSQTAIEATISAIVALRRQSRRVVGANDMEDAIRDIEERFADKATDEEIESFVDWVIQDQAYVIRYNSSQPRFKERLFRRYTGGGRAEHLPVRAASTPFLGEESIVNEEEEAL